MKGAEIRAFLLLRLPASAIKVGVLLELIRLPQHI